MYPIVQPDNAGHRRYTYFKDNNGKTYGQNEGCAKPSRKITVSWWIYYLFDCDYCMCTCWEQSPSTPPQLLWLINLMSQLTDWKKNKYLFFRNFLLFFIRTKMSNYYHCHRVLTGVRFVRTDRTVAIQIKQGKLLPSGAIDSKTDEWKPIEKIEWGDKSPAGKIPYFKIKNGKRVPIKKNRDYAFIGKKTQINLDEIVLPKNFIATGENNSLVIFIINLLYYQDIYFRSENSGYTRTGQRYSTEFFSDSDNRSTV